jgi:hypothetical protein
VSAALRIALFGAVLALVFGGAVVAGAALDPDPDAGETHASADKAHGGGHEAASAPAGLALAEAGLRLDVEPQRLAAGRRQRFSFRVIGPDGDAVRDFDVEHDRRMHLIVVRRDLTGFQHLHPRMAADGTWSTPLELAEPGSYRVFADFKAGAAAHTLGADVHVPGRFEPRELPHSSDSQRSEDGDYEVRLAESDGELRFTVHAARGRVDDVDGLHVALAEGATKAGAESDLAFTVTRAGKPVAIQNYLGAKGHLVALRQGDLAFLHVHPESTATVGSDIRFRVEYPSAGRYRLFLQFKHDGRVRTVAFTQEVGVEHGQ